MEAVVMEQKLSRICLMYNGGSWDVHHLGFYCGVWEVLCAHLLFLFHAIHKQLR